MSKTKFRIIVAAAISFALDFGGNWITYSLLIGRGANNKDDFIKISLIEALLVLPLVSIFVGSLIGWLEERNRWWLAGVSLLPLVGYLLYDSFEGQMLILCFIYLFLASSSALLISRLKSKRDEQSLKQV
jgi:hypothetical protein